MTIRKFIASLLYSLGDLVYRVPLNGPRGAVFVYTTYNTLMLWSIDVQGDEDGPWEKIETASELSQSKD